MTNQIHAIILCAGIGERLRPPTYTTNKNLLPINGKPLIQHLIDTLIDSKTAVKRIHICIGHFGYKFRELFHKTYRGVPISFLTNPLYKVTGAAQTLYIASPILRRGSCLVLEGDHYMHPTIMTNLMQSNYKNCILVDQYHKPILDEETLAYGQGGLLSALKWLPPYPEGWLGEALTLFKMDSDCSSALANLLEEYLLENGSARKEIIEPFNRLIKSRDFHYEATGQLPWIEVDTPQDLAYAREMKFK